MRVLTDMLVSVLYHVSSYVTLLVSGVHACHMTPLGLDRCVQPSGGMRRHAFFAFCTLVSLDVFSPVPWNSLL